jgi:hypothetical protein
MDYGSPTVAGLGLVPFYINMSFILPDLYKVNDWLRERGVQGAIRDLHYNPSLSPDCAPALLDLFGQPLSFYVRAHIAGALFARPD